MLVTLTGRMVRSHGTTNPLPGTGRVILTPASHGKYSGALRNAEPIAVPIVAGTLESVELVPGPWRVQIRPAAGPSWPTFMVELLAGTGTVDLADLAPVVVIDGERWAAGPEGPQGERGPEGPRGPQGETGPQGTTAWADLTGKPATYPPATHTHEITDVDGLQAALPRTTAWESLGTLPGLTAGTCRFRWTNGQPQLALASVEWAAGATIPWTALPADARIDTHSRSSAVLTATTDLTQQATIIAYSGFIYMGKLASPQPMTGMIAWTI